MKWIIGSGLLLALLFSGTAAWQQQQRKQALAVPDFQVMQLSLRANPANSSELEHLARYGHPLAARIMAEHAKAGGDSTGMQQAADWYEQAAQAGDEQARFELGMTYLKGEGRTQDLAQARHWFAALPAMPQAQFRLGQMLINGEGGPKDVARGRQLVETAADKHERVALFTLGNWYRYGDNGKPKDEQRALHYYQAAANWQYAPALQELAMALDNGEMGLEVDTVRAQGLRNMAGHIATCKENHTGFIKLF
ncbi:tetratricopeptide repeat protein [Andreprevotia chitinilytica]|uniref:tetratricopeptide repeat protein n=1 Tax=Andreprevotia chitinilytica TaxID=396808 RepID=UPI0006924578|nr:tetratricopeptide repeat protein [Andreprevotia chitinilytica]